MAGRYPKDFKWTGWHPHCRCHALTILKTEKEMEADTERILNGEEPLRGSVNEVKSMPDNFTKWVAKNQDSIENAKSLPYWIKDNKKVLDGIINVTKKESGNANATTPLSPKEKARRNEIKEEAKKFLHGLEMHNTGFGKPMTISNTSIKEWLNQPFSEYMEKNEALLKLPKLLKESKYLGYGQDKHDTAGKMHLFETIIGKKKS